MSTLPSIIPDADCLLALTTEELAEVLLRIASENLINDSFHPTSIFSQIDGTTHGAPGYPIHRLREVKKALAEALNWLSVHGIFIRESDENGKNGW